MPDRKAERAEIIRLLTAGQSIQMLAPRRVGKTWLMHRIVDDLDALGWTTVFTDVEGMRSEDEFLRDLCRCIEGKVTIRDRIFSHLSQRLKQVTTKSWEGSPINAIGPIEPKGFSEELVATLDAQYENTLILVDEIALFVAVLLSHNEATARDFLYHLRRLRQKYRRVRWLLTGSIGLDVVARRAGLHGALVDLETFPLEPFSEPAARTYLNRACTKKEVRRPFALNDAAFAHLAGQLGWLSPYYLKLVADRIRPTGDLVSGLPSAQKLDIDAAFEELLAPAYRTHFAAWEEHLKKNFPREESDLLHAILNLLCETSEGETFDTLQARLSVDRLQLRPRELKSLLVALVNDGFLQEQNARWRFRSGLLRRYWLKYMHE